MNQFFVIAPLVLIGFFLFLYFVPINPYIIAIFSGVKIELMQLVVMRIRKVPPGLIVNSLINATKAGIEVTPAELETHYLAGGKPDKVIKALIIARQKSVELSFKQAAAIDLSGKDPVYFIEKRHLEGKNGVESMRKNLIYQIENELDEEQVKDLISYVDKWKVS